MNGLTPKPRFRKEDGGFALLSVVFAFFFLKYAIATAPGIALTVTAVLWQGAVLCYALLRDRKITLSCGIWAGILTLTSLVYPLTDNGFLKGWTVVFQLMAGAYWVYLTFGNRTGKRPDDMLGFDLLKSLTVLPFGNVHEGVAAVAEGGKKNKTLRTGLFILLGLGIALIPTAIVFSLLVDGDAAFSGLTEYLFRDVGEGVGSNMACLFFALPFGGLIFGLLYGSAEQKYTTALSRRWKDKTNEVIRFAPSVIACAALTPMLLVYVLFFIAQGSYYFDAFRDLLPEGYTYAEYAREGFFHLVAVCAVNGGVILAVHFFTKRRSDGKYPLIARIYVILFSLFTLLLAVLALRKMWLYVSRYDLTITRVYATWFTILLAIFFLLLTVKQFIPRFNGILAGLLAFLILFAGLCLCDPARQVAQYNLDRYLSETDRDPEKLDLDMFARDLAYAGVCEVNEAYDRMSDKEKIVADRYFYRMAQDMKFEIEVDYRSDFSFRSWNRNGAEAEKILRQRCPGVFHGVNPAYGWTW